MNGLTIYRHASAGATAKIIHALVQGVRPYALCGKGTNSFWRICSPLNTKIDCPKCLAKMEAEK